MPSYCSNCATALDQDARFCPSCRAPIGVSHALKTEITQGIASGVHDFVNDATRSVPGSVWVAAIQTIWWIEGFAGLLAGGVALTAGLGALGFLGSSTAGMIGSGPTAERLLLSSFGTLLYGALNIGLSTVLIYGLLTLKQWASGVFKVWLAANIALTIIIYLLVPSKGSGSEMPLVYIMLVLLILAARYGAMAAQFVLMRRNQAELAG